MKLKIQIDNYFVNVFFSSPVIFSVCSRWNIGHLFLPVHILCGLHGLRPSKIICGLYYKTIMIRNLWEMYRLRNEVVYSSLNKHTGLRLPKSTFGYKDSEVLWLLWSLLGFNSLPVLLFRSFNESTTRVKCSTTVLLEPNVINLFAFVIYEF